MEVYAEFEGGAADPGLRRAAAGYSPLIFRSIRVIGVTGSVRQPNRQGCSQPIEYGVVETLRQITGKTRRCKPSD
jgi:hypothetical protein